MKKHQIRVAIAQIAPVWLNQSATMAKIIDAMYEAKAKKAHVVAFGEALLPGYPFWLSSTGGAQFDEPAQKAMYAHYAQEAICIEAGDFAPITEAAAKLKISVVLGMIERPEQRGGHSLYCSAVYIDQHGELQNVHRKLMPTYEERLVWSIGDAHGLRSFKRKGFTLGALNCWENWMPLTRTAMYAQGVNLLFSLWPGSDSNTADITRFVAKEGRCYVVSVSSLMRRKDIDELLPLGENMKNKSKKWIANGGSCIAQPDGTWLSKPIIKEEGVFVHELQLNKVFEERQNFDPTGHYSRPDALNLRVYRDRQGPILL